LHRLACEDRPVVSVDAVTDDEVARLRRELERLPSENHRLSPLLELRGQDTADFDGSAATLDALLLQSRPSQRDRS
jgi:hypothetical protein